MRPARTCSMLCSALFAPGPTKTCRGARRRRPGCLGAPGKPHENALDEHWRGARPLPRLSIPSLAGVSLSDSKWLSDQDELAGRPPAPPLGEDTEAVLAERAARGVPAATRRSKPAPLGAAGKPFPLHGIKILDFSWFLASAGGTRFLAAMGAEASKWSGRITPTRGSRMAPSAAGGADAATGPLPGVNDPDMGGHFNNKNPGKRAFRSTSATPGLEIAKLLVASPTLSRRAFRPVCWSAWGWATK